MEHLMRLYNIIHEGFRIDVQIPTDTATSENYKWYTAQLQGKSIVYSANDSPEDIIKIEPALTSKRLSEFIVDTPTKAFKNSKIFIGFTTSPSSGVDTHDTSVFSPKEFQHFLDVLYPVAREWTGQELTQAKMFLLIKQLKSDELSRIHLGRDKADPAGAARVQEAINIMAQIHEIYMQTKRKNKKEARGVAPSNYTVPEAIAFLKRNVFNKYGKAASYEIAKQLKHPNSPEQQQITDMFLKLCLQQINKMTPGSNAVKLTITPEAKRPDRVKGYKRTEEEIRADFARKEKEKLGNLTPSSNLTQTMASGNYQYIVYPESSSEFNKDLATAAASMFGAKTLEISKRTSTEAPLEVDEEEIRSHAADYAAEAHFDASVGKWFFTPHTRKEDTRGNKIKNDTKYFDTKEEFINFWSNNTSSGVNTNLKKKGDQIKNVDDSKRAFVKNLFPSKDAYAELSNKFVMLIDDNIVSSATVQMVKNLIMSINPQPICVDIFIPLKVETNK